jgi:4-hydroxy-2-oxoheptanedioate aldolase
LRNLDDIVRVDHIDVFFIAPGDLAQSMGYAGQMEHPSVMEAIERGVDTIKRAGKAAGVLTTPATVDRYLELGARYLFVGLANLLTPSVGDYLGRFKRYTES